LAQSDRWSLECDNPNTVKAAIRNKARDLWRVYRYPLRLEKGDEKRSAMRVWTSCWTLAKNSQLKAAVPVPELQLLVLDAQGYTGPEIGRLLNITSDAARARLCRARRESAA